MIINVSEIDLSAIRDPLLKAILICLFTDAYISADELPDTQTESRGWWGDYIDISVSGQKRSHTWGSRLWRFNREKLTDDSIPEIEGIIKDSLKVLLDAGVLKKIEVIVTRIQDGITFVLKTDNKTITFEGL